LKEISQDANCTASWMKPDGTCIPITLNHNSKAIELVGDADAMNILWKKGWQRITYYGGGALYCHNDFKAPNNVQKRNVIDLAMEYGFTKAIYDGGKKTELLWSRDDVL